MQKKQILLPLVGAILFGCHGSDNNNGNTQANNNLQSKVTSFAGDGQKVEEMDPYDQRLYASSVRKLGESQITCTSDRGICIAQADNGLSASYIIGASRKNEWVMRDVLGTMNVIFNKDVPTTYKLNEIYNDLGSSPSIVGYMNEVNTSDCDEIIASGSTRGKTCKIRFAYAGEAFNNNSQQIHFKFSDSVNENSDALDIVYTAKNISATVQNVPALNISTANTLFRDDSSSDIVMINYQYEAGQVGFNFPTDKVDAFMVSNVGTGSLYESRGVLFKMRVSPNYDDSSRAVYYSQLTSCQNDINLKEGISCMMPLSFRTDKISESMIKGGANRLVLNYNQNGDANPITYAKRVIFSPGILSPYNATLVGNIESGTDNWSADMAITVSNLGSDSLSYGIPISDVKFNLEYVPSFYLTHKVFKVSDNSYKLLYDYGVLNKSFSSTQKLLDTLTLKPDSKCFADTDVSNESGLGEVDLLSHRCNVNISYNDLSQLLEINKPIGALLVATYKSPLHNVPVKQILGTVQIDLSSLKPVVVPPLTYKQVYYRVTKSIDFITRGLDEALVPFYPVNRKSLETDILLNSGDSYLHGTMTERNITPQLFDWINKNRTYVCAKKGVVEYACTFSLGTDYYELTKPFTFDIWFTIPYGQDWETYKLDEKNITRISDATPNGGSWNNNGQSLVTEGKGYILKQDYIYNSMNKSKNQL